MRFLGSDEDEVHTGLNITHFIVTEADQEHVELHTLARPDRLGALRYPILFYPGDTVRFKDGASLLGDLSPQAATTPRIVRDCFLSQSFMTTDELPRYLMYETDEEYAARIDPLPETGLHHRERLSWNVAGDDLELVARGNVWALYCDHSSLHFASDAEELVFWSQLGISGIVRPPRKSGLVVYPDLQAAYNIFKEGQADSFIPFSEGVPGYPDTFVPHKLIDRFAEHRKRVRACTERFLGEKAKNR